MRVSAQTKAATRERILQAALALFADKGFGATTTRDIAEAAGIASGTLFNYFQTKETIVTSLASDATSDALAKSSYGEGDSLEEDLFAVIARQLRPGIGHRLPRWHMRHFGRCPSEGFDGWGFS
jgi:AcrR family transcriptional regulator